MARPLSPKEAARILGIHQETVRRACRRGELGYRLGSRWYITRGEIGRIMAGESRADDRRARHR